MATAASQCEKTITSGTPYYDNMVLNQQQELEFKENVAYALVWWNLYKHAVIRMYMHTVQVL